jgi:hypothetical protein
VGGEGVAMELEGIARVGLPASKKLRGEWLALPEGEGEEKGIKTETRQAVAERVGF